MANNRLILVCEECYPEGRGKAYNDNAEFAFAKYYPATGYYTVRENNDSFNQWLDRHKHDHQDFLYRMKYEDESMD